MSGSAQHDPHQDKGQAAARPSHRRQPDILHRYGFFYRLMFPRRGRRIGLLYFSCTDLTAWRARRRLQESIRSRNPRSDYPRGAVEVEICHRVEIPWVTIAYLDGETYGLPRPAWALPNGKGYETVRPAEPEPKSSATGCELDDDVLVRPEEV